MHFSDEPRHSLSVFYDLKYRWLCHIEQQYNLENVLHKLENCKIFRHRVRYAKETILLLKYGFSVSHCDFNMKMLHH